MQIADDGKTVTLSVEEMNHHLDVRGTAARDVGVAFTAGAILVASAFGWNWIAWVLFGVSVLRLAWGWYRNEK